jgi:post-segregation antitoxin (ccd killing protein)
MGATVNIRVPEELKEEMDAYEVNMSAVAREAWETTVREQRRERLLADANELTAGRTPGKEHIDEIIRADRDRDSASGVPTDE